LLVLGCVDGLCFDVDLDRGAVHLEFKVEKNWLALQFDVEHWDLIHTRVENSFCGVVELARLAGFLQPTKGFQRGVLFRVVK